MSPAVPSWIEKENATKLGPHCVDGRLSDGNKVESNWHTQQHGQVDLRPLVLGSFAKCEVTTTGGAGPSSNNMSAIMPEMLLGCGMQCPPQIKYRD